MVEERLTDSERRRLVQLAIAAVPATHGDDELTRIISKLSGVDTEVILHRAYPSHLPVTLRDEIDTAG